MAASDSLFDSRGRFSGAIKLSNEGIAEIKGLSDVALKIGFVTATTRSVMEGG